MKPIARALPGRYDFAATAAKHRDRYPCLLESLADGHESARFDLLFAHSGPRIEAPMHAGVDDASSRFLERLDEAWRAERVPRDEALAAELPFRGGWVMLLSYELAAECEPRLRLPAPPARLPRAIALRAPAAAIYDHRHDRTVLIAEPEHAHWLDTLQADLIALDGATADILPGLRLHEEDAPRFLDGLRRVHDYLRAGDVFQVNLSRAWSARFDTAPDALALYRELRRANPAPFAGIFLCDDSAVISSSPERLVAIRGDAVETRPIAGTRPRESGDDDAARVRELIGHPKERAEHIMLIDLERNDLGRVCRLGSIEVNELMSVESYTHVHHIVSNVRGRLRDDATPGAVIRAVFPGGTITGCPKVRCMEIIAELEGEGRGPYTGAMGYLNRDGDLDLNILIRTIWLQGDTARIRAGGGIVADSIGGRELEETRAKARGMLRALGAPA